MNMISPAVKLDLLVENVHCAGCIAKIENAVKRVPGVAEARMNMTSHRLAVELFDPTLSPDTIVDTVSKLGYPTSQFQAQPVTDSDLKEEKALLLAMAVAGFAAANVMLLSVSVWAGSDMGEATRNLFHWLSALIALPTVVFSGRPFFRSAWSALKHKATNMDVPISLAIVLASAVSVLETAQGGEHAYFDAAVSLLFFLLIGRYLDFRARRQARSAAARLLSVAGDTARLVEADGSERTIPLAELRIDMRISVLAGETVPADGIVIAGASDLDTSLLTGESVPESVARDSKVYAGTSNLTGALVIAVTQTKDDTLLAGIVRMMDAAESGRSAYIRLADRVSRLYAPVVHALAFSTFALWWIFGDVGLRASIMNAVAVLIITCPCALALAVPVVRVVAHGLLFARGVMVKSADALERLAQVDLVVFDKTGTLTLGKPQLIGEVDPLVLKGAAALARKSRHPLSQALANAAQGMDVPQVSSVREEAGSGVEGIVDGVHVRLGRRGWVCPGVHVDLDRFTGAELWYRDPAGTAHRFMFRDQIKEDAAETIAQLRSMGLESVIISGDRAVPVASLARELDISRWDAECRPDMKVHLIDELKKEGYRPLMVGDGLNDAPALAAGFVSASPASAADISRTASDIVFQGKRLAPIVWTIKIARISQASMRQNIALAVGYNVLAIPIAIAGFVTPLVAAIAMSTSSVLVTMNALRIRRAKLS